MRLTGDGQLGRLSRSPHAATIMHFAMCLPGWNSLDSVRRTHSDLEGAALVFFALLIVCEALAHLSDDKKTERRFDKIGIFFFAVAVLAEIAAYPYGQRNDTLSEQVIVSLDAKARDAANSASTALDKSGTALSNSKEAETKSTQATVAAGKAEGRADAAAGAAKRAEGKAEQVGKKSDAISARLDITSQQLSQVEERVRVQGPRWKLLIDGEKTFVEALKPFKGQKVTMVTMRTTAIDIAIG